MSGPGWARSRVDGPVKVTGAARYAADTPAGGLCHGVLVASSVARGHLRELHTAEAEAAPGVVAVLTHRNAPRLATPLGPPAGQSLLPLQDDRIFYEGQPIALVVAETLEQAQAAAALVTAAYLAEPLSPEEVDFRAARDRAFAATNFMPPDSLTGAPGELEAALASAAVRLDRVYSTADRHHNAMEPSATVAEWHDGKLTLHDATQWVWGVRMVLAAAFGIPRSAIRVIAAFTGGGYGCKGYVWPHQILAAMAAREVARPVKLVLTRAQTFTSHGYQAASEQRVSLAATRDGRLTALRHESLNPTSMLDDYVEYCASPSRTLYACPLIETRHRVVRVHRGVPTPMRSPHEGPGLLGLECALDELACELGIDPVELRLRNYAERHPTSGSPFSAKSLRECYREGAERFGWSRRQPLPRAWREGRDLVGWGMATALMPTFRMAATARVTLEREGTVLIEAGTQEIGTGVTTIMPQIAAGVLGIAPERVRLVLGDTTLPETGGTFGSSTTMGVGSAVLDAAGKLKALLAELADDGKGPPATPPAGRADPGDPADPADPASWPRLLARHRLEQLSAEGAWSPGPGELGESAAWSIQTFGAVFVEVRVDEELPVPRVTRCTGVYSAGRIINPKTARSQITGGMTWGIGQALLERSELDPALGRYLSKNLSGYLVPVQADVPELEASFIDEFDPHASPLGAKGIGELGSTGIGPAIANAVFHATGVRVRELPILPERLLAGASGA